MQSEENSNQQDDPKQAVNDISSDSFGTITGNVLWVNDPPPDEELVETYGQIEFVGNKVRIVE
ncbi:hypothetical protein FD723_40535 (plasmid) [Nostoc sp. C052]|uniref:hypothetical protein n=1 Tax=Nostoc sp. C052 TaxID=2576902 RepID=UPI0015C3CF45|nr:hypothetical protein [Nostoc sp. C052]QLE46502.1 hypothetical protein FD723_40535 [Nostoc sp. C052]